MWTMGLQGRISARSCVTLMSRAVQGERPAKAFLSGLSIAVASYACKDLRIYDTNWKEIPRTTCNMSQHVTFSDRLQLFCTSHPNPTFSDRLRPQTLDLKRTKHQINEETSTPGRHMELGGVARPSGRGAPRSFVRHPDMELLRPMLPPRRGCCRAAVSRGPGH